MHSTDPPQPGATNESPGARFDRLVEIMRLLRSPDGCPWDREQTLASLQPFVLEETYEVLDAIDRQDLDALQGEIGDLLFEGVFLAQVAAESGGFTIADALASIVDKLIRRHPHVFERDGDRPPIGSSGEVLEQWERLKAREREDAGRRETILGGVPKTLPALLRAYEIGTRVASVGFDWPRAEDVVEKIEEEVAELRQAIAAGGARADEEMGDLLLSIANLARKLRIEPEGALRRANEKFAARFGDLEQRLAARGSSVHQASLEEMETAWRQVKDGPDGENTKGTRT